MYVVIQALVKYLQITFPPVLCLNILEKCINSVGMQCNCPNAIVAFAASDAELLCSTGLFIYRLYEDGYFFLSVFCMLQASFVEILSIIAEIEVQALDLSNNSVYHQNQHVPW